MESMKTSALDRAKQRTGGATGLAQALNALADADSKRITPQAISQWKRVPPERCLEVERVSGVSRYELRPDVYGPEPAEARA
jgi:DNA-binding transcriptional regulator YdaS (Cro superfamily)